MNKNKKILYALIAISVAMALIIARLYLLPGDTPNPEPTPAVLEARKADDSKLNAKPDSVTGLSLAFPGAGPENKAGDSSIEALKQADDLDMNLVDASLREYIHALYFKFRNAKDRDEFLASVKAELLHAFPVKTAEKILKIYETYIDCEIALQEELVNFEPAKNEEDMLFIENEIYDFRKTRLGEELAEKLFGQEHRLTIYKIQSRKIYADTGLYGREKETRLHQLAAEVFGDEDAAIYDKTGESLFQEKLLIYKKDLDEMSEDAKKEKIREFRAEYLPPEDIEKIEAAETQVEAAARRDQDYTESKNAILNDAGLDDAEKQEKIRALQDEVYGDMADEIRRGEEFAAEHNERMEKALPEGDAGEGLAN